MIAIRERQEIVRAWGQDGEFMPSADLGYWPGMEAPVPLFRREGPLAALPDGDLSRRFHGWRGLTGRRYVCTIFSEAAPALELADAVVIAVTRGHDGQLHALSIIETGSWPHEIDFLMFQTAANALGASEWHVHLLANHVDARAKMMADLRFVLADGRRFVLGR